MIALKREKGLSLKINFQIRLLLRKKGLVINMKNYAVKDKKTVNEAKVLKRFFGILLFVLAVYFRDMLVSIPKYSGIILAAIYLLIQYKLWLGDSEKR